jgi:glycosyltransferase involved in cell wall biosynthesis
VHGHQVGGTNPSLVEALGAGNAVIAHDNRFNRWVAGDGAQYFNDAESFSEQLDQLLPDPSRLQALQACGRQRFDDMFVWEDILGQYEDLLRRYIPNRTSSKP